MAKKNKQTVADQMGEQIRKENAENALAPAAGGNRVYTLDNPVLSSVDNSQDMEGFVQRTIPFITVKKMFPGMTMTGTLVAVEDSGKKDIKSQNLVIEDPKTGQKVKTPCSAVIAKALDDEPKKFIGHTIRIIYKGKAETAEKGKNKANLFEVFTRPPAKKSN